MRFLSLTLLALLCSAAFGAELAPDQIKARSTQTKEFTKLLVDAAKHDGELGLSIAELERVLGEKDEAKETDVLFRSPKWIYRLSADRRLEVITDGKSVSMAAVVAGTKVERVWK